jgi:hypothetical protein
MDPARALRARLRAGLFSVLDNVADEGISGVHSFHLLFRSRVVLVQIRM